MQRATQGVAESRITDEREIEENKNKNKKTKKEDFKVDKIGCTYKLKPFELHSNIAT